MIVLDTHVLVWLAATSKRLGTNAREALADGGELAISTVPIALRAGSLDPDTFPGDPADRVIYATAVEHGARLATADGRLRAVDPARIAW